MYCNTMLNRSMSYEILPSSSIHSSSALKSFKKHFGWVWNISKHSISTSTSFLQSITPLIFTCMIVTTSWRFRRMIDCLQCLVFIRSNPYHIESNIPFCSISCCMCLNRPSTNLAFILNPRAQYASITCSIDVFSVLFFISLISSAVLKCVLHDIVITNGILLMNIISIAGVNSPCFSIISCGMSDRLTSTCFCVVCVVFPFTNPS